MGKIIFLNTKQIFLQKSLLHIQSIEPLKLSSIQHQTHLNYLSYWNLNSVCTRYIPFFSYLLVFRIARAGIFPRSSLLGAGQLGLGGFGKGGTVG
jgi:hypothetical protein